MPWCPKCRTEYREGFTHCNDCGAKLVDEVEKKPKENKGRKIKSSKIKKERNKQTKIEYIEEVFLVNVGNEVEIAYITSMLEQEGIAYRIVEEDAGQYLSIIHGRSFFGKDIFVNREYIEKALKIKESYKEHFLPEYELDVSQDDCFSGGKLVKFIILGYMIISLGLLGAIG